MEKRLKLWVWFLILGIAVSYGTARNSLATILVRNAPNHGLTVARVDLSPILKLRKIRNFIPINLRASFPNGRSVPIQFIPDDENYPVKGILLMQLPKGGNWQIHLTCETTKLSTGKQWNGTVATRNFLVAHDGNRMGALPYRISFQGTSKVFETFLWNDRVYHRKLGGFLLRNDTDPQVQLICDGEIAALVRVRARYCQPGGKQPASQPKAVYDWVYFRNLPFIFVTATIKQSEAFPWHELHFLELNFPDESFRQWAGGEPLREGKFEASQKSFGFTDWGALIDGNDVIAFLRSGQALFHDGRGGYGTYLHAHGDAAWQEWQGTERRFSAWLLVGTFENPIPQIRSMLHQLPTDAKVTVTLPEVRKAIAKAKGWHRAIAEKLEAQGRFDEAMKFAKGKVPANWLLANAGDLGIAFERTEEGIGLQSLFDRKLNCELLAEQTLPLFTVTLRHLPTKREIQLKADRGWQKVEWSKISKFISLRWQQPKGIGASIVVSLQAWLDSREVRWSLNVTRLPYDLSLLRVSFPQLAIADLGENAEVFFPRGPGEVQRNLWKRSFTYRSLYPNGWATMQFLAAYGWTWSSGQDTKEQVGKRARRDGEASAEPTGIYVGVHDPNGSAKEIIIKSEPEAKRVILAFEQPVPNMGVGGNEFGQPGRIVWQILRGDWFDAAMVYRNWVRGSWSLPVNRNYKGKFQRGPHPPQWFPELSKDGRKDTPQWMKELCLWALGGGAPKECVPIVKEFAKFMGVPVGFHWYNWHQIPFDNDYPHYFPPKEGFAEGVKELQQSGVFVMPYINGRLWDTRDKGTEDWQFSKIALPAATKGEEGSPYTESYGSKEADGSDVKLSPMCPATKLWQDKVLEIVLRLFKDFGVNAVYIDQVAAAPPALCFDKRHPHPFGGGSWWNEGYWQMLNAIRKEMPEDRMLTTECNAEPFVKWFDGYLTWHWQHDGQVPAFPAVYGGSIQMFGRAYRGGPTKDLALKMKAGQQLVFGEQIGWIDPNVILEKENAEFLRQVVRLRWQLSRYFYAGEMARPLKLFREGELPVEPKSLTGSTTASPYQGICGAQLIGNITKVRADWQWAGEWWVETDAIMTGAWKLPQGNKLVLLFVNVSDRPLTAELLFDGKIYGLKGSQLRVTEVTEKGRRSSENLPVNFRKTLRFPPSTAFAWEIEVVK